MLAKDLGWNDYFEACWKAEDRSGLFRARVIDEQREVWRVAGEFGEVPATPSGKLRRLAEAGADWPAVGDWVALAIAEGRAGGLIEEVLPRKSRFVRKRAGKGVAEQVLAANVDTALLVSALDGDFNTRRIERYLSQAWESGARPVILLNKADRSEQVALRVRETERIAMGVPVIPLSAETGEGLPELERWIHPGDTLVLLGSSGVGKSTLVNRLAGAAQATREVRPDTSRGRHTTTARTLFVLPGGAMIIDTPGLRELQLWNAREGVARAFGDIEELAAGCRFRDCTHGGEPGCAVARALEDGSLERGRMENLRKLEREQRFELRKADPAARQLELARWKQLHREARKKYKQRELDGGKR